MRADLVAGFMFLCLGAERTADACDCVAPEPWDAKALADDVFVAWVKQVALSAPISEVPSPRTSVTFAVEEVIKGRQTKSRTIKTTLPAGGCRGFHFEAGQRYVVFLRGGTVDQCGGTRRAELYKEVAMLNLRGDERPKSETPVGGPKFSGASDDAKCTPLLNHPPGKLTLSSKPFALAYTGSRFLGETPLASVEVPAGCVEVRLVSMSDGQEKKVRLNVSPLRESVVRLTLDEL